MISMASIARAFCLQQSLSKPVACSIVPKRYRYYWENRAVNWQRKMLMMVTLPKLNVKKANDYKKKKIENKLYGLDVLLHKEVQEIFSNHRMIVFCLKANQLEDNYYYVRYELQQHDMCMECYDQHVLEFTLKGTQYENLLTLFNGPTAVIFGKPNVNKMLLALKKNKQLLLLGGMLDGKMMNVTDFEHYAKLSLDYSRSELCGILSMATSSTYNLLNRPASVLTHSLSQYVSENDAKPDPDASASENDTETDPNVNAEVLS